MTNSLAQTILSALTARGQLAAQPAPLALAAGNGDRRPEVQRSSWQAVDAGGRTIKLTLARTLGPQAAQQAAFAAECPGLVGPPGLHEQVGGGEALGESFFPGTPLELAVAQASLAPAQIRDALAAVERQLAATERRSDESARRAEWLAWQEELLALPLWSPAERDALRNLVLPGLYALLSEGAPVSRWTNGDFTSSNILLAASGESRLIDLEFARRTHFFREDAVRFFLLSPAARQRPELFAATVPAPGPAWHLFFWLRQLGLEAGNNTPAYLARMRAPRLAVIRRLAEQTLGCDLAGWSESATPLEHRLELAKWIQAPDADVYVSGWCYLPPAGSRGFVVGTALASGPEIPLTVRPDVQQHQDGAAGALATGFGRKIQINDPAQRLLLSVTGHDGLLLPFAAFRAGDLPGRGPARIDYGAWAASRDPDPPAPAGPAAAGPRFSVLLPVYNTPLPHLRASIGSVLSQYHSCWELVIIDDASPRPEVQEYLQSLASTPGIKLLRRATNGGIARATNDALAAATGEFIVLLDHDDLLRPHALAEFASALTRDAGWDVLYSDEDKITEDGRRLLPLFKPDYSPEFLRGVMYAGHALCVRTVVARAVGGFDPAFDGIQDYEFLLRVTERSQRVGHIPKILYHWRQSATSSALEGNVKGDMDTLQLRAVTQHLQRLGDRRQPRALGRHRLRITRDPAENPPHLLVRLSPEEHPVEALRHAAATSPETEVVVLLHRDLAPLTPDALAELLALARLPDSGGVAPLLISPSGHVLESGCTFADGQPVALMRGFDPADDGYHGSLACSREVAAISPHCVAIRRQVVCALPPSPSESWHDFSRRLGTQGLFHRVCAGARVEFPARWDTYAALGAATGDFPDRFFPPAFDRSRGDYSLTPDPALRFHLDHPAAWREISGCLRLHGWCFSPAGQITGIRLRIGNLVFSGVVGLPRPDVRAVAADAPGDDTGFEVRGNLPAGHHTLYLEARTRDGEWQLLSTYAATIKPRRRPLWLGGGGWTELLFSLMPTHMAHAPRPLQLEKFPRPGPASVRPRLTIVTPSYNQARFLAETLDSVLDQPGVACAYAVQDGGSTDDSADLIRARAPRLLAAEIAPDGGQADAIARGFAKTSGAPEDIMAWINSDDFYVPGALAFVTDYFARHPDVDVVYGHRIVVDEDSQEIARWFLPKHDPAILRLNDFVPQETMFWRRRIWDKVGGIDPTFKFAMDWDLLLRFQAAGAKIVRVPYFLACFRIHSAQKTSAQMQSVGQGEITRLRERTFGRTFPAQELETNPTLLRYLRRSAFIEFLWRLGLRAP